MNRMPNCLDVILSRGWRVLALAVLFAGWTPSPAGAQELPRGAIIDDVKCAADATQSYALYLPSAYTPGRQWNLLLAFHPAARGRAMVEKYAAAAEQYGYIVAGSNTSRNGPWLVSGAAVQAMSADLGRRFAIDAKRVYMTGLSGGARVAMQVALGKNDIAGVIASSAGYPDSRPRSTVPFAVFATAGTEDFNYLEMRQLDRKLTSPHHLTVFKGGHALPPDDVALEAIEWMELQAMKSDRRTRDEALVERLFAKRQQQVLASKTAADTVHLLDEMVADFKGLRDVSAEAARGRDLSAQPEVRKALARERSDDDTEARMLQEIVELEAGLRDEAGRAAALLRLQERLTKMAAAANAIADTPERSRARRVLRAITAGAADRVDDREYRAILEQYRLRARGDF